MNDKTDTKAQQAKENEAPRTEEQQKEEVRKSASKPAPETSAKSKELIKAAEARAAALAERGDYQVDETQRRYATEVSDEVKASADEEAQTRVQSVNNSLTGKLDIEAMGDVKGNGGDAKNYPDGDPDKALGVPVYEYGLNDIKGGAAVTRTFDINEVGQSERTNAEIERGKKALNARHPRR